MEFENIQKHKRSIRFLVLSFVVVFSFIVITFAALIYNLAFAAPEKFPTGTSVQIESGQSLTSISKEMKEHGVVRSSIVLRSTMILLGGERNISAGMYEFNKRQNVIQVGKRIVRGDFGYIPVKVTIPEGSTVFKVAEIIHEKIPSIDQEHFLSLILKKEGYLFPNTYFFPPKASPEIVVEMMQALFNKKVKHFEGGIAASGRLKEEIIIMASILEGEVQTHEDRKMVADLLWRRISLGMPLQVDSTLTYITGKSSAELTLKDLKMDSPYNSYIHKGLPPTPISNPGIDSIEAALYPTSNQYLFFLSDKDGITHFAKTHEEHVRLKNKYLR